jgi:LAO/AO transport system kinase
VRRGDRAWLGRAITLVESTSPVHIALAQELLVALLPYAGRSHRIGITGVPGVGKSTFIDAFGTMLTASGHRVAVLAVDPSSSRTGGSILGDKTRMERLSVDPGAFIRPSPSAGTLGGVARATRESIVAVEAAGYDVVLVETVGVGQSETVVAGMVDVFVVLMLPGAGDELQGIKKGILELADLVAVNKADGDNANRAREAAANYANALHLLTPVTPLWHPPVLTCSGRTGEGLDAIWQQLQRHRDTLDGAGLWTANRQSQQLHWMWAMVDDRLRDLFRANSQVASLIPTVERDVRAGRVTATMASARLLDAFLQQAR